MSSAGGEDREGGHVSVTTIHMSGPETTSGQLFVARGGGVRISVPDAHDDAAADAEVSSIDFSLHHYQVNMRHKKQLAPGVGGAGSAGSAGAALAAGGAGEAGAPRERPMSWEGELSDSEMVIDTTLSNDEASNGSVETLRGAGGGRERAARPPAAHPAHPAHPAPPQAAYEPAPARPPSPAPLDALRPIKKELWPEVKCEPAAGAGAGAGAGVTGGGGWSPLAARLVRVQSAGSADSAVHSLYHSSPAASRRATPSLSRNNSDASHSSCYSYSTGSELSHSPAHSPTQARHGAAPAGPGAADEEDADERLQQHQGISRQQLINSPCPICGDKISGFHYGIFSCESCKGFFKRTVQNRKNYMCLRGGACPVAVATRKKCPACRFDKCLARGMKLEAIREDRTRGGRSTYQCSYSLSGAASTGSLLAPPPAPLRHAASLTHVNGPGAYGGRGECSSSPRTPDIPPLLQEIMDVEHLWQYNEAELATRTPGGPGGAGAGAAGGGGGGHNPLLAGCGITAGSAPPDFLAELCHIADHRLYKIVKWCKSLPLFKNISIDDQICLLINSWCELLVLSCCYRGVATPGEVRLRSAGACLHSARAAAGLQPWLERMLSFTEHLRRLRVDRYEYVALKVIVLLTSDAPELREPERVRAMQERALAALQHYTARHSPRAPAKFGELLLRIPELQRTCQYFMQVGKEMLSPATAGGAGAAGGAGGGGGGGEGAAAGGGDAPSFNLLMELLRGDH